MLDIYRDPIENPIMLKASDLQQQVTEVNTSKIHTLNSNVLHAEKKLDITCRNLALQSHHSNKNTFDMVVISAGSILQKQHYVHGLKHDITIAPGPIVPINLSEFHNCKGHQGIIHTFEAIRRSYSWSKLCQDVLCCNSEFTWCRLCSRNLF